MTRKFLRILPALLGLTGGLTGCLDQVDSPDPAVSESRDAGKISFRIGSTDLAKIGVGVDSVRIEAVRPGYATQSVVGNLSQETILSGLQSGAWTIKVALFDANQSIHWYGEVVVQVVAGQSVPAEVHLRQATGSVVVRIVLDDSVPPTMRWDTLYVQPYNGQKPTWTPVKYWRTAGGVYLVSSLPVPCSWPVVTQQYPPVPLVDTTMISSGSGTNVMPIYRTARWVLGSASNPAMDCIDLYQEHTHFIPWSSTGEITLVTSNGEITLPSAPTQADTFQMTVKPSKGIAPTYLPILSAFRDDTGIHILTSFSCAIPVVRSIPDSGTLFGFGAGDPSILSCVPTTPHATWIFVPWTDCHMVQLRDAYGKTFFLSSPIGRCTLPPVPGVDTVAVPPIFNGDRSGLTGLPIGTAWRTDKGVYIETKYDCNVKPSLLVDPLVTIRAGGGVVLTPVAPVTRTMIACSVAPHILFYAYPPEDDVTVRGFSDTTWILLPGRKPAPVDSSFQTYTLNIYNTTGPHVVFTLDARGVATRITSSGASQVDTIVSPLTASISPAILDSLRAILESSTVRHPSYAYVCTAPTPSVLPIAAAASNATSAIVAPSIVSRLVDYTNGAVSAQKNDQSQNCKLPASWTVLDKVDALLYQAFSTR